MKTRETALNNFAKIIDELAESKYLLANNKIFELIAVINSSKMLSDTFRYFIDGFDFEQCLINSFQIEGEEKVFIIPEREQDILAFTYLLLQEINYKNVQLTDMLDHMGAGKNYEVAYKNFCNTLLLPFKNSTLNICRQIMNAVGDENSGEEIAISEITQAVEKPVEKPVSLNIRLSRLLELDALAVTQSRISEGEKEEILYVIDLFKDKINEGNGDKIKLAYLAYYYVLKPYKKINNNVKAITDLLASGGVL